MAERSPQTVSLLTGLECLWRGRLRLRRGLQDDEPVVDQHQQSYLALRAPQAPRAEAAQAPVLLLVGELKLHRLLPLLVQSLRLFRLHPRLQPLQGLLVLAATYAPAGLRLAAARRPPGAALAVLFRRPVHLQSHPLLLSPLLSPRLHQRQPLALGADVALLSLEDELAL